MKTEMTAKKFFLQNSPKLNFIKINPAVVVMFKESDWMDRWAEQTSEVLHRVANLHRNVTFCLFCCFLQQT
jgi:hypothetical protein